MNGNARIQSAMEYLITYGWAILILGIVIASLYALGVFKLGSAAPSICGLPADIGCLNVDLAQNGLLTVNLQQATQYTINVIGVGCNNQGVANVATISPQVTLPVGGNSTFAVQCWTVTSNAWVAYNAPIGSTYTGYLVVNYTDISTGFEHTAEGTLIQKVKN